MPREIAPVIVTDDAGHLLLQHRDDIPGILCPGKIGLFGGHREDVEPFLSCAVREINEELSLSLSSNHFEFLARYEGPDFETANGRLHIEFFVVRGIDASAVSVTEGRLLVVPPNGLDAVADRLTPVARFALDFLFRTMEP